MSIFEDVSAQMKSAMKARDAERLKALRGRFEPGLLLQ